MFGNQCRLEGIAHCDYGNVHRSKVAGRPTQHERSVQLGDNAFLESGGSQALVEV